MIEQMTGKSITELFDWMVGTSTGAILALGMVYGQCQECMYIHNKEGRRVRAPAYYIQLYKCFEEDFSLVGFKGCQS